jgi:hypothetical protein
MDPDPGGQKQVDPVDPDPNRIQTERIQRQYIL